ncbi:hypothetical protein SRHO_G00056560 [Serrasalmus rhombeus]
MRGCSLIKGLCELPCDALSHLQLTRLPPPSSGTLLGPNDDVRKVAVLMPLSLSMLSWWDPSVSKECLIRPSFSARRLGSGEDEERQSCPFSHLELPQHRSSVTLRRAPTLLAPPRLIRSGRVKCRGCLR